MARAEEYITGKKQPELPKASLSVSISANQVKNTCLHICLHIVHHYDQFTHIVKLAGQLYKFYSAGHFFIYFGHQSTLSNS